MRAGLLAWLLAWLRAGIGAGRRMVTVGDGTRASVLAVGTRASVLAVGALVAVLAAGALAAVFSSGVQAADGDPAYEARIKRLESELRCLVCQNQTLADSSAELAQDLRSEVRRLAQEGRSDPEIKTYLVARYGDFVLYRPPVKSTTWLLWAGPFLLLGLGALVWWMILRRRAPAAGPSGLSEAEREHARSLLG